MKNKILFLMITMFLFLTCSNVKALSYARVTSSSINTYAGPGTNYSKSTVLKYNDVVPVFNTTILKTKQGCSAGWYKITINGNIKYVCKSDVSLSNYSVRSTLDKTILRNGAGTNYAIYTTVGKNVVLTLDAVGTYSGTGCSAGWYKLKHNAVNKYVCKSSTNKYNKLANAIVMMVKGSAIKQSNTSASTTITTLKYGQAVTIYETTLNKGAGCSTGWVKVYYKGAIRYICNDEVTRSDYTYFVSELDGVNVRSGPGTNNSKITFLPYMYAAILANTTTKYTGTGCDAGWYKIKIDKQTGYVCSSFVSGSPNLTVTNAEVMVKESPNSSSNDIIKLANNKYILLAETKAYTGEGCTDGWYKIDLSSRTGYICAINTEFGKSYIDARGDSSTSTSDTRTLKSIKTASSVYYTANKWTYRVKENFGYVRSSASTSSTLQEVLYLGTEVQIVSTSAAGGGCSAGWYKIKYYNNKTGFMCKSLIEKYSDVTRSDSTYCNQLKEAGFPASYCPYLSYLHYKHPSWIFTAENTGVTFLAAINGESEKNYTQIGTNAMAYLASTAISESPNWRTASDAYVAYMLDPRNYLNEQNAFAFEDLSYDSKYHTISAIRSMVSGSYLDNDTYANYFLSAAKTYNVSPVHLAARVKQEGGTNSNYDSVSGKATGSCSFTSYVCARYADLNDAKTGGTLNDSVNLRNGAGTNNTKLTTGLKNEKFTIYGTFKKYTGEGCYSGWYRIKITRSLTGIYNFYNIGAYGDNPVNRGLKTAAGCVDVNDGTPWNTREKAIKYGASFIANGYINKGQNTMYYQKFNTGPNAISNRYTHQYMTNILAPASESLSTYDTYNSLGLLNKAYSFKIPVYNSMPSDPTAHPPVK